MAENGVEKRFADAWRERNRIQPNITSDWGDYDRVHGRNQLLTFHIRIRDEKLIVRIKKIQDKLSAIPCFDPFPKDYFHITVKSCGFLAKSQEHEDDIPVENVQKIVSQAKEILQPFHKFNVMLSKLNIFSDVVLVEVHDKGRIRELNKELQAISEIKKKQFDYPDFLPHISIAQFQNNQEFARLISYVEELRETEFGELTVSHVELVNAHLSGKYPLLKTIHAFRLS